MADWANLPHDLLRLIAKPLASIDILRIRSVCASWRSSVPRRASHLYLTISPNDGFSHTSSDKHLRKCTILLISPSNDHPHPQEDDPRSWIVKIRDDDRHPKHFFNPIARNKKWPLPDGFPRELDLMKYRIREVGQEFTLADVCSSSSSSDDGGNLYMEKVVILQSDFNPDSDFVLLTIHISGKLALFKSGDKNWTIISEMPMPYDDVVVYKGTFYGVDNLGRMVRVGLDAKLEEAARPVFGGDKKFLVESDGELLLVDMYLTMDRNEGTLDVDDDDLEPATFTVMHEKPATFTVYKLDQARQRWIEMKSWGDRLLFLGCDCTFSVSASDFGYEGSFIFFEGDDYPYRSDVSVFGLGSRFLGPLGFYPVYSNIFWPPPSWVTSTSQEAQNNNQQALLRAD